MFQLGRKISLVGRDERFVMNCDWAVVTNPGSHWLIFTNRWSPGVRGTRKTEVRFQTILKLISNI